MYKILNELSQYLVFRIDGLSYINIFMEKMIYIQGLFMQVVKLIFRTTHSDD